MFGIPWAITINGSLLTFILVIYGQLLFSGFSDYFGWFGVDPHPISLTRIISFLFIGIGIFLLYIESFFG
jgi:transporter family-2 protein